MGAHPLHEDGDQVPFNGIKREQAEKKAFGPTCVRVLIVDDNVDAADSLAMLLELFWYEVHVAYTGPEAIQAAMNCQPQVILLDVGLPGMDGYQVIKRLREQPQTQNAIIVALTGYGRDSDRERSKERGSTTIGSNRLIPKRSKTYYRR